MTDSTARDESVRLAAAMIAEVSRLVNEFRDQARAELVRHRNHLWAAFLAVEVLTFLLFAFTINMRPRGGTPIPAIQDPIVGAISLYLVGALVGIFNWAYQQSGSPGGGEDFGLYYPRLAISSAISGLAAVGGVFLTVMVAGSLNTATVMPQPVAQSSPIAAVSGAAPATIQPVASPQSAPATAPTVLQTRLGPGDIFSLHQYPYGLFLAVVFGFSPAVFIQRLNQAVNDARQNLESSKAA